MSRELEEALDECLRLRAQGRGVEECLLRYPSLRRELQPLLEVAARSQRALAAPQPSAQAQEAGRARVLASLPQPRERRWAFLPRGLALALSSFLALVLISGGAVAASWGSLPGEALYGVKQATEKARLGLTPSPQGKASLLLQMAEKRMEEIEALEERGALPRTELPRQRLGAHLRRIRGAVAQMEPEEAQGVIVLMQVKRAGHQGRLMERRGRPLGPPPVKGRPPAVVPAPMPTPAPAQAPTPRSAPTPTPATPGYIRESQAPPGPPGPQGASGPDGTAGQAGKAGKAAEALEVTPTPPPPIYGLAAAVEDYEQAFQELLKEIEKKPHPPRPRRRK